MALVIAVSLSASALPRTDNPDLPRFEDYPSAIEVVAKPSTPRVSDSSLRRYRTQLRDASRHAPDFAGHYTLASWGCGAGCIMLAAIDAKTGIVTNFPFTVSNWPLEISDPLDYRLKSHLLIIRGDLNEKSGGSYFYDFSGNSFHLIRKVEALSKR